jgi:dephospho-CoA kinase
VLYYKKDFINTLEKVFPNVVSEHKVDKRALRNIVFSDNSKLKVLENLIHPFLKENLKDLIRRNAKNDDLFFLDVALLFEMGWDIYCDLIIVTDVDYEMQKQRVMKRDNITAEDFDKINDIQMDNKEKTDIADVVINTNQKPNQLRLELINIIKGMSW